MASARTPALDHVDIWIFDLDLTLYAPEHGIMDQVRNRIAAFVEDYFEIDSEAAHKIRHEYWRNYGTTLGGLMAEHGVDLHDYLDFVHDVDLSALAPCERLRAGIEALPGRKLVFTNADAPYARRVLERRGLEDLFECIFDIHRMEHKPKPARVSYDRLCAEFSIRPERSLFVEDSAHNLEPAKAIGMTTVWLNHADHAEAAGTCPPFVDHEITDLADWLGALKKETTA